MPNVQGMNYQDALNCLYDAKLAVEIECNESTTDEINSVVSQSIRAGDQVTRGTMVTLVVAVGGEELVEVPDVFLMGSKEAVELLRKLGFLVEIKPVYSRKAPEYTIAAQEPAAGSMQKRGSTIYLSGSKGEDPVVKQAHAEANKRHPD